MIIFSVLLECFPHILQPCVIWRGWDSWWRANTSWGWRQMASFGGGLPCSLHVWISRGTSGKSRDNPRGICNGVFKHDCVRIANLVAARYAMVVLVCLVRQVMWVTEQPASSVAPFLPYLEVALYTARQMLGFPAGLLQKLCLSKVIDWKLIAACVCVVSSRLTFMSPSFLATKLDGVIWIEKFEEECVIWLSALWFNYFVLAFSLLGRRLQHPYFSQSLCCLEALYHPVFHEKFKWNSAGNIKLSRTKSGRKNVSSSSSIDVNNVDMVWLNTPAMHGPLNINMALHMRSGGPRLTSTQAYPTKFCNKVASYHKKFCVDTWSWMTYF